MGEWCKEHWKLIVTVVLVVVAVVLLCTGVGGPLGVLILGICKGLLIGALTGGLLGTLLRGLFGGIGGLGQLLGSSCQVLKNLGSVVQVVPKLAKVFNTIALGMGGFDLVSFGAGLIWKNNPLTTFNQKLHSNSIYNIFQMGVSMLAVLTSGFAAGMKNPICFVGGTMILTAGGLCAIEQIKAGDRVIAANEETLERAEKKVLETYIRETNQLVHLRIQGENISTTEHHPFYVRGKGFVEAGRLLVGEEVINAEGTGCIIEEKRLELAEEPVRVYNFQVEGFHTYHVGSMGILVHNTCGPEGTGGAKIVKNADDVIYNESSIDKAFGKHGQDFGKYPDGSKTSVNAFTNDVKNLINNGTQVKGTYRTTQGTHIYNPSTKQWAFINSDGTFNTAFKLSDKQYKYLIETGVIK